MREFSLSIGNKTYSSWSLRAWLMMKQTGAAFDEVVVPLGPPGSRTLAASAQSPSGRIPALHHGDTVIWESTAIGEYLYELFPNAHLWPADRSARAHARSISEEMHAGFAALRTATPMNVRRKPIRIATSPAIDFDVQRILAIWGHCRSLPTAAGGPFLFGRFGNADAMFAPVATRFRTYGIPLDAVGDAYVDAIYAHPPMIEWIDAAKAEPWVIDAYEAIGA